MAIDTGIDRCHCKEVIEQISIIIVMRSDKFGLKIDLQHTRRRMRHMV